MPENQPIHEPAYTSRISPLKQFTILFCIVLGFIGMSVFIPMVLLFGYMVIEGGHVALYVIGLAALPLLAGIGIWVSKLLFWEMKKRIIENRYPSGYDLYEQYLSFQVFDTGKNQYIYGKVPYTEIEKCVISVHADPILVKRGKGRFEVTGYHYFPVVHIIYEENGERTYFARTLVSESTTMDMLGTLSRHGIPLEITDYDLGWVPQDHLIDVVTENILTKPLNDPQEITEHIDQDREYREKPVEYMDAYHEWLMNKHGVVERNLTPWHTFALFIVLSLLSAFGFKASDPGFFQVVIVPYGVLVISYIAFIYVLKEPKFWKTIFHAGVTLSVYIVLLYLTGHDPFTMVDISSDPDAMGTLKDKTSEAVIGTVVGFYGGSYIWYLVAERDIRDKWAATFHKEMTDVLRRKQI
ncbi:MAG TPA: hypothetical protein VK111_11725 [Virgibacillus sp.]|nr:hypothetical protein [Virgibacillus sp.]